MFFNRKQEKKSNVLLSEIFAFIKKATNFFNNQQTTKMFEKKAKELNVVTFLENILLQSAKDKSNKLS